MASIAPSDTKAKAGSSPWRGFRGGLWQKQIDVRDFIQQNYDPYEGGDPFLAPPTQRTRKIWDKLNQLFVEERKKGVPLDYATSYVHSPSIMSFRDRGRFKQGVLYHQGSSYRTSAEGRPATPSVKSSLRLHGSYTMDGELIIPVGEKGVFLDCFG